MISTRYLVLFVAALLTTIWITAGAANAQERPTGDGVIQGTVTNGTTGEPAANVTVVMSAFSGGTFVTDSRRTTDEQGRFEFEDLVTEEGITYAVEATHDEISFGSGRLDFSSASDKVLEVEITVYESTQDSSLVSIQERAFILSGINAEEGEINVLDVIVLDLEGDAALVANEEGRTVEFAVPRNASQITPFPGADFDLGNATIEGATVYASSPLLPGTSTATLGYTIPYTGQRLPIELAASYDTEELRILIPDQANEISVAGGSLEPQDDELIGNQSYKLWTLENFSDGTRLNLAYQNLPQSAVQPNTLSKFEPTLISISAVAVAALVVAIIVWKRGLLHRPTPAQGTSEIEVDPSQRGQLIEQLRALEAAHKEGAIDPAEYRRYRRVILEQLRQISRLQRGSEQHLQAN